MKLTFLTATILASLMGAAMAQDKPELVVYTYDSFASEWGPGPVIEPAFEAVCACDLQLVAAGDGAAVLSRLRLEGNRSAADVVLGLDTSIAAQALASGLFVPHGIEMPALDLPVAWTDAVFVPFDWGYFAFVYDKTRTPNPPRSFADLRAMPDTFKIVIQDPRSSTPGLGLLLWVEHVFGDQAAQVWGELRPNILTVTAGWSEAYGLFLAGEAEMVLSYTTSPAYHMIAESDDSKAAAAFAEGHYMQIEVAARLQTADQPLLAKRFLEFILSEPFQTAIPQTNWMYPAVRSKAGLPQEFDTLIEPSRALLFSADEAERVADIGIPEWVAALAR